MPQNFIECGREQPFLMPPSLLDWVPEGHLVWTVLDAVEEMELRDFLGIKQQGHHHPRVIGRTAMAVGAVVGIRRGRAACRSEWRLIAATHNLLKLHNHRITAAGA